MKEVRCTSTDFNGSSWDGPPFTDNPKWLQDAVVGGKIWVAPCAADYAGYWVKTDEGIRYATAGDTIGMNGNGNLYVRNTGHWEEKARLKWNAELWGPAP